MAEKDKENAEMKYKHQEEIIEMLKEDKKTLAKVAVESTSTLSFIVKNYNNAPNIQKFDDFSLLKFKNNAEMVNMVAYKKKKNIFDEYVVEILIEYYKKEEPSKQSIWNTDINRLSYTVKDADKNKNNISVWMKDKKGILLTEYAINPILEHIKKKLSENSKAILERHNENKFKQNDAEILELSYNLANDIETGEATKNILKCLASHFFLKNKD